MLVLWALLALFVIYPLASLFARIFRDDSGFGVAGALAILADTNHVRAFWNSLLLGSLVGLIGTAAEAVALLKGAKNAAPGKKLIDWAASPAMQGLFAKYKINFVPAHPDVAVEPGLADVLKGARIFPIDADYAGANRKRVVDRWIAEVLNAKP